MDDLDSLCGLLYERMKRIHPGIEELEPYEFRYCLDPWLPLEGEQAGVPLLPKEEVERLVNSLEFYAGIQLKPRVGDRIVLDKAIVRLTKMLLVGLATGAYPEEWVAAHFYLDIRGFYFLHRTAYFTDRVIAHLGGRPFKRFEPKQKELERCHEIGYKAFKEANAEVDRAFIEAVLRPRRHEGNAHPGGDCRTDGGRQDGDRGTPARRDGTIRQASNVP